MKKIFSLVLSILMMSSFALTGCEEVAGWLFYPDLRHYQVLYDENDVMIYNDQKYYRVETMSWVSDLWGEEVIVGRMQGAYGQWFAVTVSSLDIEQNILYFDAYSYYYVKEGCELFNYIEDPKAFPTKFLEPTIEKTIEKIFLADDYDASKKIEIKELENKKLVDAMEDEKKQALEEPSSNKVYFYYILQEQPYLVYHSSIKEYKGDYYIALWSDNAGYKINGYYRKVFMDAIEQLNS